MRGFTLISSAQIKNRKKENPDDIDQMPIKTDVPQPYIAWRMVAQQTPGASGKHRDTHEDMEGVQSGGNEIAVHEHALANGMERLALASARHQPFQIFRMIFAAFDNQQYNAQYRCQPEQQSRKATVIASRRLHTDRDKKT